MSRKIKLEKLTDEERKKLSEELTVYQEPSKYSKGAPIPITLWEVENNFLYIPFAYGKKYDRPNRESLASINVKYTGKLRPEQEKVKTEAIDIMNKTGSVIIAAYPGFGKTTLSLFMASRVRLKTLIICHRIVLINQWIEAIKKFCPKAKVCLVTGNTIEVKTPFEKEKGKDKKKYEQDPNVDFYIMNAINIPKRQRSFYEKIGLLIVDEIHLILANKLSKCMAYVVPRYMIGLSATPYRNDGIVLEPSKYNSTKNNQSNVILDMYGGKERIFRKLYRRHIVYKIDTGLVPEEKKAKNNTLDWGSILEFQALNTRRNELIIRLVKYFPDRVFLILCKRVDQADYLINRLKEEGLDVTSLVGNQQEYKVESNVLVGMCQKCSTGFDHPRLNTLLLASDVENYFVQYLGRVFRTQEVEPVVFDIVDKHGVLYKHFNTRREVYTEHGGIVKNFYNEYPKFS